MAEETVAECKARWVKDIEKVVKGKTIVNVRYMTDEEVEIMGWGAAAVVLQLSNGTLIYPSMDDEGNGAGAIFTTSDKCPIFPVIRNYG